MSSTVAGHAEVGLDQHPLHVFEVVGVEAAHERADVGQRDALDARPEILFLVASQSTRLHAISIRNAARLVAVRAGIYHVSEARVFGVQAIRPRVPARKDQTARASRGAVRARTV